jgi:hypothetical protein
MDADDQHLLIVGAIKYADPSPFRQIACSAPEKVVPQFRSAGVLEAEYLAALGIDAGHHVLDDTILSRRIHRLEDQQDRIAVSCVEDLLQRTQLCDVVLQRVLVMPLRLKHGLHVCRPFAQIDLLSLSDTKLFCAD